MRNFFAFLVVIIFPLISFAGDFESTVKELIEEKIGNQFSLELRFDGSKKYERVILDQEQINSVTLTMFSVKPKAFKVLIIFDDPKLSSIEVFGKFEAYYEVYVATRHIKYGDEISTGDIKILKTKKLRNGESTVKHFPNIFGMQAKFTIKAGQIIKRSDIKNPSVIKEHDPVTIMYSSGDITLKTLGIALASGAVGEKIRVKNERTGIVVFGEIIDKNVVKVNSNGKNEQF